jgi:protein-tyrosine phosphatase
LFSLSNHLRPFDQSYWVQDGLFCAGHYPGDLDPATHLRKLAGLLDSGIVRIVNLMRSDEHSKDGQPFVSYMADVEALAQDRDLRVDCLRFGIPDAGTPSPETMRVILDVIDWSIAAKEPVYVHCWGGHGRTSTVVGCYLIRHGASPEAAIHRITTLRRGLPKHHHPFEGDQEPYVRAWAEGA